MEPSNEKTEAEKYLMRDLPKPPLSVADVMRVMAEALPRCGERTMSYACTLPLDHDGLHRDGDTWWGLWGRTKEADRHDR
jgi:hypothetical protein